MAYTFDEYFKKYTGVGIDYDGRYSYQCFDLANHYCVNVLGGKAFIGMYAYEIYENFANQPSKNLFTRIANTPAFVPQKGDIMVWAKTLNGKAGHVAICNGVGDTTYFYAYDENWDGKNQVTTLVKHNYNHVLGVLRPKDQSKINPTTNSDTNKGGDTMSDSNYKLSTPIQGVDLSYCQPNVDFAKLKANGIKYVILRAGYGNALAYPKQYDTTFENHYKAAKAAGLDVGVYWYSYANSVEAAKQEAKSCIKAMQGKKFEYPIYFDIEEKSQFDKGVNFCDSIITAFCTEITNAGYYAGVYCSTYWFTNYVSANVRSKYPVWIAEYNSRCTYQSAYGMWQNGISKNFAGLGEVDHDYCYVDYPKLIKALGKNGYTKSNDNTTPTTPTTPTTYKTYYVNDKSGVNYRVTPNGTLKGTYKYGTAVKVVVGSETKVGNYTWVKIENGCYMAKNFLSTTKPTTLKSTDEIAKEVIAGKWGNGETRKQKLTAAGYNYNTVQKRVNEMLLNGGADKKSIETIAKEVIAGKWGNGTNRVRKLAAAGYDYNTVQRKVNELLKK